MTSRLIRSFGSTLGACLAVLASITPVLAECVDQQNRAPAFADIAPTAKTIFIATVVDTPTGPGASAGFTIEIDEVLRGRAPSTMVISGLKTGLPLVGTQGCKGSAAFEAVFGQILAFALDGRLNAYPNRSINTVAWIKGEPPDNGVIGGEVLPRDEVRRLAGLPDTSTDGSLAGSDMFTSFGVTAISGLTALLLLRSRRRANRPQSSAKLD